MITIVFYRSSQNKYQDVLSDFRYFKDQDGFEKKVNSSDVRKTLNFDLNVGSNLNYKNFILGISWSWRGAEEELPWDSDSILFSLWKCP